MNKQTAIDLLSQAVKDTEETYNQVSNGETSFVRTGHIFNTWLADEQLNAMKRALEVLRG